FSLALSSQYITNKYTSFESYRISQLGGPAIDAKYAWDLSNIPGLAVGAALHSTFLTSTGSGGIVGDAVVVSALGVSSYKVHPNVEVSLNLGYQFDNSRILIGPTLTNVDTYALGLGGPRHSFVWGAGAGARLPVHP